MKNKDILKEFVIITVVIIVSVITSTIFGLLLSK